MSVTPVYRPGTSLDHIINDGWSRGFDVYQTLSEAAASGFTVTTQEVRLRWRQLDDDYEAHLRSQ